MTLANDESHAALFFASLLIGAGWPGREALALERESAGHAPAPVTAAPPVEWGMRISAGAGAAAGGGPAWRAGLDAEYWLWRNIGIGVQFGYQAWSTLDWCTGDCHSASGNRFSVAPSVTLRGNNPANFPIVSLALGWSWGHTESASWCDYDPMCPATYGAAGNSSGPYGSLTAAWVFHPGVLRPGAGAFAIGPMVRVDGFSEPSWAASGTLGGTVITGMAVGFGLAGEATR